jgi:putative membrane protein
MFRAFLTDWLEADNEKLEAYLDELGIETELDVTAFVFRRRKTRVIKTLLLVSNFHPGPFLNVGSSDLPYLFQALARKRLGAIALVPHGVSGHELNLVSQIENEKIMRWVFGNLNTTKFTSVATPVVRSKNDLATATSQVFDGCGLVTMTTSPSDMEDVPTDVANRIAGLTKGKFRHVALIDAHNCLTGPTTMSREKVGALEEAALDSLQCQRGSGEFKIGAAHRNPVFQLRDGFGPGGISVMAVETNGETFAYISIDGNNMVKGLREQILAEIRELGFADGEVLTSDTHMVNGITSARLGYYPIGAAVPRTILLQDIKSTCSDALADLEVCEVGVLTKQIGVTTLGSKSLRRVMNVVYQISKLTAIAIFPIIVMIAVLSLLFLM